MIEQNTSRNDTPYRYYTPTYTNTARVQINELYETVCVRAERAS